MADAPTRIRYRALAWLSVAAGLAYLCRNAVGVAESKIREETGLTEVESGWFMGAFFWSYALFQIPAGQFSARRGTRVALTVFALAWAVAAAALGASNGLWMLIAAQLVMGAAQAGSFPAAVNSVGHWMPLSERSFGCGVLTAGMQVGAIAAGALTGLLIRDVGWRWVFFLFAGPSVLWAVAFALRFRDRPEQDPRVGRDELAAIQSSRPAAGEPSRAGSDEGFAALLRNGAVWWLCGQQVCRAAGYMFFASWFPTFLQKTRGIEIEQSGYMQAVVLTGTLVGCLLGGACTDLIWRRTGSLLLSRSVAGGSFLCACAGLILAAWFVQSAYAAVALLAAGSLVAALAGPCAFAATIDLGGNRVPQVFGLMNMTGNFAAAACPVLVGRLFAVSEDWNVVLLIFAGVYLAGAVCWAFVRPAQSRNAKSSASASPP